MEEEFFKDGGTYKSVKIEELFEINSSKKIFHANNLKISKEERESFYPYVVRSSQNNGIKGYIKEDVEFLNPPNTLSFAQDTFTIYYQEKPYFTGNKVKVLKPIYKLNYKIANYIITSLNKTLSNYTWGVNSDVEFIKKLSFVMPIKNKNIDYNFIEEYITEVLRSYIKNLEKKKSKELQVCLKAIDLDNYNLTDEEVDSINKFKNIKFKDFKIEELFSISTGRDVIIGNVQKGDIPLISHQHANNGITKYVSKLNNRKLFNYKDTIPLADRGVFLATTQMEDFQIGTRVKALSFKTGEQSENVRLFFVTAINKLQVLFDEYLNNATDKLPELSIMLPVDSENNIDYNFIDIFIRAQKKLIIKDIISTNNKIIDATNKIIDIKSETIYNIRA